MKPITSYLMLIIMLATLIDLIPCLYPFKVFNEYALEADEIGELIGSTFYVRLIEFSFVIVTPMLLDVMSYYIHKDSFYYNERVILIFACPTPHCILYGLRLQPDVNAIMSSLIAIQSIWISGPLVSGILQSKILGWKEEYVKLVFGLFVFGHLTPLFAMPAPVGDVLHGICATSYMTAYVVFALFFLRYFRSILPYRNSKDDLPSSEHLPLLCILMLFFYQTALIISQSLWGTSFSFQYVTPDCLAFLVVMSAAVCSICTIVPGKIARAQANEVQSVLDMKKSFVRYIGHEIRTPLNVASIGLDLLSSSLEDVLAKCSDEKQISTSRSGKWTSATSKTKDCVVLDGVPHLGSLSTVGVSPVNSARGGRLATEELAGDVTRILDEVRKALVLGTGVLNDLLLYDKLDSSNLSLEKSSINVSEFVSSTLDLFAFQASALNINFVIDVEDNLPALFGDQHKLRHVLCNLASNALKFTPAEGTITCTVTKRKDNIQIQFRDTGVGIASQNLPKVFKSIIQFDANINQGGNGSGLGLYITRGLVESHGGFVSVHSDGLGTGCTFTVSLPLNASGAGMLKPLTGGLCALFNDCSCRPIGSAAKVEIIDQKVDECLDKLEANGAVTCNQEMSPVPNDCVSVSPVKVADATNYGLKVTVSTSARVDRRNQEAVPTLSQLQKLKWLAGYSALIVDDSVSSLKMLRMLLNRIGCNCICASDGSEAVTIIKDNAGNVSVDFILMDNFMPNMNGTDACVEIRRLGYTKPIIGLTGHALNDDIVGFKVSGADRVLSKPLDLGCLYTDLKDLLPLSYAPK
jgi:signal transduction histidine kinase/CheY-like chemotaxis protein